MKSTEKTPNLASGQARQGFSPTPPSGGITNVSAEDNSSVMMNLPQLAPRGSRADTLIEMAGDDAYRLGTEEPRKTKMKG